MKLIQITKEGYYNLKKELKELIEVKKPKAVVRLQKARAMGDLSENSEYSAAKEELAFVEGRIQEIETILKTSQIVENQQKGIVNVGVKVTVENKGKKEEFHIVGEFEADPSLKKLSHKSPIGKALIGKKVGDWVEVEIPAGRIKYKIVDIQ